MSLKQHAVDYTTIMLEGQQINLGLCSFGEPPVHVHTMLTVSAASAVVLLYSCALNLPCWSLPCNLYRVLHSARVSVMLYGQSSQNLYASRCTVLSIS